MDLSFLKTAAFWVGLLFAYLIPKMSPYIDRVLSRSWVFITDQFPGSLRRYFRGRMARKLRVVRAKRWRIAHINYEIARSNSWFIVFMGTIGVFLILLAIGPFKGLFQVNFWIGMALTCPIYIAEFVWLHFDNKVKQLIKYNSKIRITSRSTGARDAPR